MNLHLQSSSTAEVSYLAVFFKKSSSNYGLYLIYSLGYRLWKSCVSRGFILNISCRKRCNCWSCYANINSSTIPFTVNWGRSRSPASSTSSSAHFRYRSSSSYVSCSSALMRASLVDYSVSRLNGSSWSVYVMKLLPSGVSTPLFSFKNS